MKKQIFSFLLVMVFGIGVSAQTVDKMVEKIRKVYTDVSEKARLAETDDDHGSTGELVMNQLDINKRSHQWRAVGIYNLTYKFYYKGGDSEEHMYPDQLVTVVVDKRISDRGYTEEFLYSDTGALMFYFQKAENDDMVPAERRVYFSLGKPIRIMEDTKTRDRLTVKDLVTVKNILADSARIKAVFKQSIGLNNQ